MVRFEVNKHRLIALFPMITTVSQVVEVTQNNTALKEEGDEADND